MSEVNFVAVVKYSISLPRVLSMRGYDTKKTNLLSATALSSLTSGIRRKCLKWAVEQEGFQDQIIPMMWQ